MGSQRQVRCGGTWSAVSPRGSTAGLLRALSQSRLPTSVAMLTPRLPAHRKPAGFPTAQGLLGSPWLLASGLALSAGPATTLDTALSCSPLFQMQLPGVKAQDAGTQGRSHSTEHTG